MASIQSIKQVNEYITEYLRYHNMLNTLEKFNEEVENKQMPKILNTNNKKLKKEEPRFHQLFNTSDPKTQRELNAEKEKKQINNKYKQVIQAARQIFSVSISLVQNLLNAKEVMKNDSVSDFIENYKIQLGKYHKIVINEGKPEGNELITETVMQEHKIKMIKNYKDKNTDLLIEVLLSLRVNALQIAPELRKNLVYELIRNDILNIEVDDFAMIEDILNTTNSNLKHAITSLISVISSTLKGVEYLISNNNMKIIEKTIDILKEQENGTVTQRFCIAILQKSSVKDSIIPTLVQNKLIFWTISLLKESLKKKIHIFCLDFSSAMLANVIHSPTTLTYLENYPETAEKLIESLLNLIKDKIPVSVLMHLLISLSYLNKDCFKKINKKLKFVDKIQQFVEIYSKFDTTDNEALEIDKKTVLDLCAHMFHPKDITTENSESMEGLDLKSEDRIREYENEQGELIFECFQDEVN